MFPRFLALGSAIFLFAGCATSKPIYQHGSAPLNRESRAVGQQDGLQISCEWLNDQEITQRHFGVNATRGDLLILSLRADNRSSTETVLIAKTNFSVELPQAKGAGRADLPGSAAGGEAVGLLGAAALSPALIFAAAGMITSAETVAHNFQVQEIRDCTLGPGGTAAGCVYFRLKNQKERINDFTLKIAVFNVRTKQQGTMSIDLHR